jgi:ABC-type Fe3+/spermidine/putrescine transport system ATPase subunit
VADVIARRRTPTQAPAETDGRGAGDGGRPAIVVDELSKSFGEIEAVRGVSFEVAPGEVFGFLGPNGAGKSTTINMLCTLARPSGGRATVAGHDVAEERDEVRRNIGLVFQDPTLDGYLTAEQNLRLHAELYGAEARLVPARMRQVLEMVGLTGLEDRYAPRLSGGQQQRVALARALIYNPRLLLFDEPLSNLDAKLRERMRHEIRKLQREVGITSVYVTHDQAEAMIISDRIIVMNRGRIEQEGDARTLYTQPASAFVATFLGVANLVRGLVVPEPAADDQVCVRVGDAVVRARGTTSVRDVYISIRPEDIELTSGPAEAPNGLCGAVEMVNYLGNFVEYVVRAGDHEWRVQTDPHGTFAVGDQVSLLLPPDRCLCLPA